MQPIRMIKFALFVWAAAFTGSAIASQLVILPDYQGATTGAAIGVSDDGSVVVGVRGFQNASPIMWTNGIPSIPGGGSMPNAATGVSADGQAIVGGTDGMYRWVSGGAWTRLGGSPGYGAGHDISADGSVVVGWVINDTLGGPQAAYWSKNTGLVNIGRIDNSANAAYAVSDDGSTIVGGSTEGGPSFIWTASTGIQPLSKLPPSFTSRALAISGDGKVVVGGLNGAQAYRWESGHVQLIGLGGEANGVSDDGDFIIGNSYGSIGWIWTPSSGSISTTDFISQLGLALPPGWGNPVFYGMTPDASVLVGGVYDTSDNAQPFYVVVPEPNACVLFLPALSLLLRRRTTAAAQARVS